MCYLGFLYYLGTELCVELFAKSAKSAKKVQKNSKSLALSLKFLSANGADKYWGFSAKRQKWRWVPLNTFSDYITKKPIETLSKLDFIGKKSQKN